MAYNLNQLSMITGLTTRTLRNYLRQGLLQGEKTDGLWLFEDEQVDAFLADPSVRRAMSARRNALVYDFLADAYKRANRSCVILDCPVPQEDSAEIQEFFARAVCEQGRDIELRCMYDRALTRVILSGAEDSVADIMRAWYGR